MTTSERWKRAQEYERGYWEGMARRADEGSYRTDFYQWRAQQLMQRLQAIGAEKLLAGEGRIVELGSGPVGIVGFLPGREKVAVDPLNTFYATNAKLTELRRPEVNYLAAPGEKVPLQSGKYDLVVIENCIDHVRDMEAVMNEIGRLLTDGGLLYLTVNARSRPGYFVHRILARLALDPGHPHTFTVRRFRSMMRRFGYDILQFDAASWGKAWMEDLTSKGRRGRLKALLFVSEHLLTSVARKQPSRG